MTKARSNATAEAAKGDLRAGTGTNLSGILAVGNNGDTLVADSSTSTGLRYSPANAVGNPVINSAMQVWQRGTSFSIAASSGNTFTADRWQQSGTGTNQAITVSRQATGDTTNLPNIQYALRFQRNSGQTGTAGLSLGTAFETINSIPYAGKTVTFSFYARKGADYSAASSALNVIVQTGTGTDQNIGAGWTGYAQTVNQSPTLTTTWQRFTYTGNVPSTATQIGITLIFTPVGTAGADDYYEITGTQIDLGSVALPFRTYAATLQGELAACQRYLPAVSGVYAPCFGYSLATNSSIVSFIYPVTPRVVPTGVTVSNVSHFQILNATGVNGTPTSIAFDTFNTGLNGAGLTVSSTVGSPTIAAGQGTYIRIVNSAGSILFTGCEL